MNKLERISIIFGFSFMITGFFYLIYNLIFFYVGNFINTIYGIFILALIGIYFLKKIKAPQIYKDSGLNLIKTIKSHKNIFVLFTLTIVLFLLVKSWHVFQTPLLNTASDPWIHYAVVRDALENSYFSFDYYSIYNFYLPFWYISLTAFNLVTGLSLIASFQIFILFIGTSGLLFIATITYKLSKKVNLVLVISLTYAVVNPFVIIYTSMIWPQFIGHIFIPFAMIFVFSLMEKRDLFNSIMIVLSFSVVLFSHMISAIALIAVIVFIGITLFFAKKMDRYYLTSGLICIILFVSWTLVYYQSLFLSIFQFLFSENINSLGISLLSMTMIMDYQAILSYGITILLIVGFISVAYIFAKKYDLQKFIKHELNYSWRTIIIFIVVVLIVTNPYLWYFVPLKNEYFQQIPIFIYSINFFMLVIPLFFTILGIAIIFGAKGTKNYGILAWGISIVFIGFMIVFLNDIIFGARIASLVFDFITITVGVGIFFLIEKIKNDKHKYVIFISIILVALPFSIVIRYSHLYGIGTTSYSDYAMYATFSSSFNRNEYVLSDFRMDYLTMGILWNRNDGLRIIGDVNTSDGYKLAVYPENLNDLLDHIEKISNDTGYNATKVLIPISDSYFSTGPLDAAIRDNVIPSRVLTLDDLNFYNNHSIYDKIFDNGISMAYILNIP